MFTFSTSFGGIMKLLLIVFVCVSVLTACSNKLLQDTKPNNGQQTQHAVTPYILKTIEYKQHKNYNLALDLYLPTKESNKASPLLVWIHGGAWFRGSKELTIPKNRNLIRQVTSQGYAVAAVNYTLTAKGKFPTPVQDINDAVNYLHDNSSQYNLDVKQVGMMGRSAGGHLAALLATSNNDGNSKFYLEGTAPKYKVAVVVDFFGVSDFETLKGNSGRADHDAPDAPEARLLGASPRVRPDLAKWASPVTYIDQDTPPFIMFHGSVDQVIPDSQSIWLKSKLDENGIANQLYIDEGARHGDPVFDSDKYVEKAVSFIKTYL